MTIKMSEVFELPVVVDDIVLFGERVTWEGSSSDYDEAAATAINAYDANQEKIAELKAMVEQLKEFITTQSDYCFDIMEINGEEIRPKVLAHKAVWKTPTQHLASVKADVIKSTISDIEIGMANAHLDGDDILEYLNLELNKLREQK